MKLFKFRKRLSKREAELAIEQEKTKQLELEAKKAASQAQLMQMLITEESRKQQPVPLEAPKLYPGVVPAGEKSAVAMDSECAQGAYQYMGTNPCFYPGFLGYPMLAIMSQSSDYRSVSETTSKEMTREWGKVKARDTGDESGDKSDIVAQINQALEDFGVRDLFRRHIENEMTFGRSQLYIDIKGQEEKRKVPLLINDKGVPVGSLKGFSVIEPIWSTPSMYNSTDPTAPDFFVPTEWFVLGKQTHADRLLTLIMRPVSDILKPAYNFSGLSMLQLMKPYVERWQRTTDSISDLIKSFSFTGLATDMQDVLSGGSGASITLRSTLFSQLRDNRGLMMLDKEKEEFFQFNTPLSISKSFVNLTPLQKALKHS